MKQTLLKTLLLALVPFLMADAVRGEDRDARKPNFIIVFVDDLGYADIEPFGLKVNRTPHLNRMADEGMRWSFTIWQKTSAKRRTSRPKSPSWQSG